MIDVPRSSLPRCDSLISSVLAGIVATAVLDSSSVVIVIVITMISAGLIDFERSLGVLLGCQHRHHDREPDHHVRRR